MAALSLPGRSGWHTPAAPGMLLRLLVIVVLPSLLWAGDRGLTPVTSPRPGEYRLTVDGPLVSLRAQEASLSDIVETLGNMLAIDVVTRIPRDTKLTLDFDGLTLEEALQRLRAYANIVCLKETRQPSAKITRIMVIPIQ